MTVIRPEHSSKYPLDVSQLEKGDYIPPEMCEEIVNVKRDCREYPMAVLKLKNEILLLCEAENKIFSARVYKDGVKIHEDGEASVYHSSAMTNAKKKHRRNLNDMVRRVDRMNLDVAQLQTHDRCIMLETQRALAGTKAVRNQIVAEQPEKKQIADEAQSDQTEPNQKEAV